MRLRFRFYICLLYNCAEVSPCEKVLTEAAINKNNHTRTLSLRMFFHLGLDPFKIIAKFQLQ